MTLTDYWIYKQRLDLILDQLRAHYMGQDRPLADLVPDRDQPAEKMAEQIAQVLTLHLSRLVYMDEKELRDSWLWLRAAALFLLGCCPEEDRTAKKLMVLSELHTEVRRELDFSHFPEHYAAEFAVVPHRLQAALEAVVWSLSEPSLKRLDELKEDASVF